MPQPLIYHIDVNSAFLSWESVYRLSQDPDALDLRTIPSAVGGDQKSRHGIILAKSIIFSMVAVFFLMPGLLLTFSKAIDNTHHKSFVPKITAVGRPGKAQVP